MTAKLSKLYAYSEGSCSIFACLLKTSTLVHVHTAVVICDHSAPLQVGQRKQNVMTGALELLFFLSHDLHNLTKIIRIFK